MMKTLMKLKNNSSKNRKTMNNQRKDEEDSSKQAEPEQKPPSRSVQKNHPESQILGDKDKGVQTRRKLIKASEQSQIDFISMIEPKSFNEASEDDSWIK
jgi:FtsZ-interacting cell division protein YlmF